MPPGEASRGRNARLTRYERHAPARLHCLLEEADFLRRRTEMITSTREIGRSDVVDGVARIVEALCLIGGPTCPVETGCAPRRRKRIAPPAHPIA